MGHSCCLPSGEYPDIRVLGGQVLECGGGKTDIPGEIYVHVSVV